MIGYSDPMHYSLLVLVVPLVVVPLTMLVESGAKKTLAKLLELLKSKLK